MAGQRRLIHSLFMHLMTILLGVGAAGVSYYVLRKFGY
jgi:hypothetical protein